MMFITKMKQLARSIVWWPGIDLENKVRHCECPGTKITSTRTTPPMGMT